MNKVLTEENEIKEGHGMTDITCRHGSRWVWFPPGIHLGISFKNSAWIQMIHVSNCNCGTPPKPYKVQSSRIRLPYFEAIVRGEKKEELKALSPYWVKRLLEPEIPPNVMKFICGKRVHSRKIILFFTARAEYILGRPVSEQGRIDLQLDKYDGYCIVNKLGDEVIV